MKTYTLEDLRNRGLTLGVFVPAPGVRIIKSHEEPEELTGPIFPDIEAQRQYVKSLFSIHEPEEQTATELQGS